ncbi:MAG: hypothetical protein KAX49_13145, partial [Halanaerobiales bacterium]|nr:hypothetical protein [Halanaerobiales bacterium]
WVSLRSYSLNFVSEYEFKDEIKKEVSVFKNLTEVTKIDWKEKTGCKKFFELFLFDIGVMKEYNIQDVNLMFLIEEKIKFLKIHQIQAKIAHCLLIDTLYNSKIIDMLLLNEYHKKNIIKNSKPSKKQVEGFSHPITGEFISGGYTFCYLPGLYKDLECWDFGSHYPTAIITHNISPELYVDDYYPKLQEIFKENEVKFINEVINLNPMYLKNAKNVKYLTSKGTLNKKRYEKKIEELRKKYNVKITMEDAMWKIVEHKDEKLKKYLIKNNLTRTDWDLNLDTRGWNLHPARLFKREEGILPMLCKDLLQKRNIIKYSLKNYEKNSPEYEEKNIYQTALKNLANSIYGVFGLKTFRDYKYAIGDCITTTCRMLTKKCILAGRKKGLTITSGDTDSIYGIKNENNLQDLNEFYFNFFNNWIKDFNSFCTFNLINPKTNKTETCKHAKNFEHEKTFDACIVVKKKRYYYILDGEINSKGGMFIKKDTIQIAKDLQKKLCKDLLTFKYNKKDWHEKLLKYKKIVYDQKLYKKFIIKYQTINKPLDTYGQHVIDGKTGKPKIKKDGTNQYAPIPAHIQVAKRLIEQGEDINIGDSISYIVYKSKPKIQPITIDEFENGKQYDSDYYWKAIISGILELFRVVEKENIYTYFKDCWQYTPKQLERLLNKLENE